MPNTTQLMITIVYRIRPYKRAALCEEEGKRKSSIGKGQHIKSWDSYYLIVSRKYKTSERFQLFQKS